MRSLEMESRVSSWEVNFSLGSVWIRIVHAVESRCCWIQVWWAGALGSKFRGILVVGGGWDVGTDGQCGAGGSLRRLRVESFVVRVLRLLVVEACWAATSFNSMEVEACWIELASRKILAVARSALVSERRAFTLSATAAANWVERLSVMFSSIRKATT